VARLLTLDPDTIVTTALRVARAEGLASLSMRRLAVELKVSAMAMYRHVADREELLLRMLDVVAGEVDPPAAAGSPRTRITHVLTELHRVFRQDTWVVEVLATEGLASPRILPAMEAMYAALADAGLDLAETRESSALLLEFAYGEALVSHHDKAESFARQMMRQADPERFPHVVAVVAGAGNEPREHFAANLERLLDGILGPQHN
jgi:AcrR family transcriptional regulator